MNLTVIGTGYVGLVAGTCLADQGNHVTCADVDSDKISELRRGIVPIYEPDLESLVREGLDHGRLEFTDDLAEAIHRADIVFIAVGTPANADGSTDLSAVFAVADLFGRTIDQHATVVIKSTVPVGTADAVRERIERQTSVPCSVVSNPEFLREGKAVADFLEPDRVVIGVQFSEDDAEGLVEVYKAFVPSDRIMVMDSRSAELSKYASNAFLATKLSFINEMAELAEATGANIELVRRVMGSDPRIGPGHLAPGLGYGGSCFPKDVSSLIQLAAQLDVPFRVLNGVQEANNAQPRRLFEKVLAYFGGDVAGRTVALWGIAFKPDTDDIRESPALTLLNLLVRAGATVTVFDPSANARAKAITNGHVAYAPGPYECVKNADALIVATDWDVFKEPDWERLRSRMRGRVIFDGRNVYDPAQVGREGFEYYSVGRYGPRLTRSPVALASA